jgi:hypothetical protein
LLSEILAGLLFEQRRSRRAEQSDAQGEMVAMFAPAEAFLQDGEVNWSKEMCEVQG